MEKDRLVIVHSSLNKLDEDAIYDLYLKDMSLEEEDMRLQHKHLRIVT
jgi:hypothetical protein